MLPQFPLTHASTYASASSNTVLILAYLAILFSAWPPPGHGDEANDPDWYTRAADMITGTPPDAIYTRGDGHVFLGIPYAMPSNGSNAFKVPQEIDYAVDYTDQVNLDFGPYCPQMVEIPGMANRSFFIGQQDCLTLNVIYPVPPNVYRQYPVYVVLHPGWLLYGTARDFGIQGIVHNLMARGIVVVTVEYRLGMYGLFNFGTGTEGNSLRSLYDVIAALRWVNAHISNFAGNTSAVTLGGWGDGGACLVSWLILAATNRSNELSHLFQQADVHGGNAGLCYVPGYTDVNGALKNASQVIANKLCPELSDPALLGLCIRRSCSCGAKDSTASCEKKTQLCTETSQSAAQRLYLPVAQMEPPDGALFPLPLDEYAINQHRKNQSATYKMRILHSWTRDEWGTIHALKEAGNPSVSRYDKAYLKGEFRRLFSLPAALDNKVLPEIDAILDYYTALYTLNEATMIEWQWYWLYSRMMTDFLFRFKSYDQATYWMSAGHNVLFYQFEATSNVPFTLPAGSYSAANKFNTSMVGHLADYPYVFMAEQYFKPEVVDDKLLSEWNLADVMGRTISDFVWQRPMTTYFRRPEACSLEGYPGYNYVPWLTRISREGGFATPDHSSLPVELIMKWDGLARRLFIERDKKQPSARSYFHSAAMLHDGDGDGEKALTCPNVNADNITGGPNEQL